MNQLILETMKTTLLLITAIFTLNGYSQTIEKAKMKFEEIIKKQNSNKHNSIAKTATIINLRDSTHVWLWDGIGTWNYNRKDVFNYNSSYKENSLITYSISGSSWQNQYRNTNYIYDSNNNLLEHIGEKWNGSIWENSYKSTSTYDSNNNEITQLNMNWDISTSTWKNYSYFQRTYDSNNNLTSEIFQLWDEPTSLWVNNAKQTLTYNVLNNITSLIIEVWNSSLSTWEFDSRNNNYVYNSSGDLVYYEFQYLNPSTTVIETIAKATQTFDSNHNLINGTYEYYVDYGSGYFWDKNSFTYTYDANWNPNTYETAHLNNTTSLWENVWKEKYYYRSFVGLNEMKSLSSNYTAYPNPASNLINIAASDKSLITEINVIDISGKIVLTQTENNASSTMINISELEAGLYTIEIKNNYSSSYKKIVKQ